MVHVLFDTNIYGKLVTGPDRRSDGGRDRTVTMERQTAPIHEEIGRFGLNRGRRSGRMTG